MTQPENNAENEAAAPTSGEPTLEERRALGSAEANAWTITPPGGPTLSLSEHAEWIARKHADLDAARATAQAEHEPEAS